MFRLMAKVKKCVVCLLCHLSENDFSSFDKALEPTRSVNKATGSESECDRVPHHQVKFFAAATVTLNYFLIGIRGFARK